MSRLSFVGFVSDSGKVVGIGAKGGSGLLPTGVVLARLARPMPISEWLTILRESPGPSEAVARAVALAGGTPLIQRVRLGPATIVSMPPGGEVPEA